MTMAVIDANVLTPSCLGLAVYEEDVIAFRIKSDGALDQLAEAVQSHVV